MLVFLRQYLPRLEPVKFGSVRLWANAIFERLVQQCPEDQPWRLQISPRYQTLQSTHAGENRCRLIAEALDEQLGKLRRRSRKLRQDSTEPFTPAESLIQVVLTDPESGWISISAAPEPSRRRHHILPFPQGEIPVASDKAAPSRAFAKLIEAEHRMGRYLRSNESCVDLGACPGSWSYVALARGAWVTAVDRSPVREDLLRHPRLQFLQGDAFTFVPDRPVDWLICDVIATPERSIQLALEWARNRRCRQLIVTIKFKGHDQYDSLDRLKHELPPLMTDFGVARLCANKNEACVFGRVRH
jgi:23S rRNA (cytidine2498-2'-O)-methyltransferase